MIFNKQYTVKSQNSGAWVGGRWVDSSGFTTRTIQANIQPATQGDYDKLELRPDGSRIESVKRIYTALDVELKQSEGDNTGDVVVYRGDDYVIRDKAVFDSGIINHIRYLAVRI